MEYPITGVFHSGLKQRFLGISIPFPHHRLANRCLRNPLCPLPNLTSKTLSQSTAISRKLHLFDSGIPPLIQGQRLQPHAFPRADLHLIRDASRGLVGNKGTESSSGICLGWLSPHALSPHGFFNCSPAVDAPPRHDYLYLYGVSINGSSAFNSTSVRRKRIGLALTIWLQLCTVARGLKSSRNMLIDEQVAMFLHIISHHLKNRVIKHHFNRSGETVSRSFHNVLNAVIRLQDVLFKKAEPITANSTDPRWKWFKNCLGALDGTHIKIRVPTIDKPRYRTRKGDIATNMLGVCTPDMHFVYALPGWEGSVADGRVLRDAISRRHGLKVPHDAWATWRMELAPCSMNGKHLEQVFPPQILEEQKKGFQKKMRRWLPCMVDLHNVGTFNADTGFKAGYLNELEKMLEKVLPDAKLKAKPNLESRIRTLKRDWSIVYDMLSGEKIIAVLSHKEAVQFKHRSFPYYDQLTTIYAKDRATGKDAQTAADIIEEIDAEDVATTNTHEERNDFHGCEADVSLDDMDLSGTQQQPAINQGDSTFSRKKKKTSDASDHISSTSFNDAATLLAEKIETVGIEISRSIASEVLIQQRSEMTLQESALKLYPTLCEVEGLTEDERYRALSKIQIIQRKCSFFLVYLLLCDWDGSEDFLLTIKKS
ncbi:hypothetical protein CXB51_005065 [Gossypium anomalum]|uniref:DDE Tnp4 domain-containing protein n=1 Tax=Gossypium anomalum TaxID=47600 RepID=A0A8J5ZW24_9ROSI|nr:hypothetical protein CXB51_005065 [Gossypium anomalum]